MALFKRFVRKLKAQPTEPRPKGTTAPQLDPGLVAPLNELLERRQLLRVSRRMDGGIEEDIGYQSLLLALDTERGIIWLDHLFPAASDLKAGETLILSHTRGTRITRFSGQVLAPDGDRTAGALALSLPRQVYQGPRRYWPRLAVFGWYPISAQLAVPGLSLLNGEVLDLSARGLRLSLSGDRRPFLKHRDILPLCEFKVRPGLRLRCRVQVCGHSLSTRPWRQTQVSLRFVDLSPDKRRLLADFVEEQMAQPRQVA